MVTILPRFDPGGEIGRSVGSGVSQGLSTYVDRSRLQGALENLDKLDLGNMSYGDIIKSTAKSFAGIPGGLQYLQEITPHLLKQKQALDYAASFGQEEQPQGAFASQQQQSQRQMPMESQEPSVRGAQGAIRTGDQSQFSVLKQQVPGLSEGVQAFRPLTRQDFYPIARKMAQGGATPQQINEAYEIERRRRLEEWESRKKADEARKEQQREERGLEETQRTFIEDQLSKELGRPPIEIDPYENQKAYEIFKNYQDKATKEGKSATDQEIWSRARQDFRGMRESLAAAKDRFTRPTFYDLSASRKIQEAKQWAQDHLKKYGNFRQDRDLLETLLMENGFDRVEAKSIVRPFSKSLENTYKEAPIFRGVSEEQVPPTTIFGYQIAPERKRAKYIKPLEGREKDTAINKLASNIADSIQPTDSLLLLRENLVRNKGLTEDDFDAVIAQAVTKMQESGKTLSPEQLTEVPYLTRNVRQSLSEIFLEGLDTRQFIRRIAK
jgi:hypothetical protein